MERTSSPIAKRTTSHRKPLAPGQILWQRNLLATAQRDALASVGRLRGQDLWNGLRPQWPLPCPCFRGPFEGSEPLERTSSHLWSGQSRLTSHRKPLAPAQILWQRNPLVTAQRDALASVGRLRGQDPWNGPFPHCEADNLASEAVGSTADPLAAESAGHGAERSSGSSGPFEGSGLLERTSSSVAIAMPWL